MYREITLNFNISALGTSPQIFDRRMNQILHQGQQGRVQFSSAGKRFIPL